MVSGTTSSSLHQEIARIGLNECVAKCIAATPSHDNNVGSASLLDDKSPWKILRTAPFHDRGTALHRDPKLRFRLRKVIAARP